MRMTMSGAGNMGLIVRVECPTCGKDETWDHKGFSGVSCERKPCGAKQTITQDKAVQARLKSGT